VVATIARIKRYGFESKASIAFDRIVTEKPLHLVAT